MKDAKSSMDMETSKDVRLLLNEIDRRRSAVDFNLIFLERERQLLDIKACLESVYKEGPDSERARARRLVDQSIESSAFKVKENVQKTLQEVADAAVLRKPPTTSSAPSKSKFPSSRLLATRSSSCSRCQKKTEPQVDDKRRVASAKSVGSLLPNRSSTTRPSRFVPNVQRKSEPLPEMPRSSSAHMLPTIPTKSILKREALQPKYKSSLSQMPRSSPNFLPLGLWLQKDSVAMVSKATNTSVTENVGLTTIPHPLPVLNDPVMKKPKSFQIQVLPSINIDSVDVPSENRLRTNTQYLEVKNDEPPVATGRAGKRNDADVSLSDPRTRTRSDVPVFSRNRSSVQSDVPRQEADKVQDRMTSQIIEDELLTYILERLTAKDDISTTESGHETESDGDVPEDMPAETLEHEHIPTAEQAHVEQVSISNPSLVSPEDDIVVPTPVPTPPSPSSSSSPLPLVVTPVPSPPPELDVSGESKVIYRLTNTATQTSRCSSPEEKEITILTPEHSSISSPLSEVLPDVLKTPLPSVEDPLSPPERQSLHRAPVEPEMAPVENSPSRASTLSDTDVLNRSEDDTVSYSLGQIHPALIRTLLRDRSRRLPAYEATGEDLSVGSHVLEDHFDPDLDKTDVTASTSMSEGEVRPYLHHWKSATDPSKLMHRRIGMRTAPPNLPQGFGAGDGRVYAGGLPKSAPSRRPTESSDRSFGEVTKDDPRLQLDVHRVGLRYGDLQKATGHETLHALTDDDDPLEPSRFRPESCSEGEIQLQKREDPDETSSN